MRFRTQKASLFLTLRQNTFGYNAVVEALHGIGLVFRTPRLRSLALWPLAATLLLYIGLAVFGTAFAVDFLAPYVRLGSDTTGSGFGFVRILVYALWFLLFPFLFTAIVSVFYGFLFETLSRAVEETVAPGEAIPDYRPGIGTQVRDSLARLLLNGALVVITLIISAVTHLGPIPWVFAAGFMGLLDFSASAFQRRQLFLGGQFRTLFSGQRGIVPFMVVAGLLTMIPFIGVLFLPGLAAGATLLTRRITGQPAVG